MGFAEKQAQGKTTARGGRDMPGLRRSLQGGQRAGVLPGEGEVG